ncbi:hypothetical protein N7495_004728 [Penicillium taxi]|uniref:uncharacterized protein n=1 Tax=Penicillium taxi TaxID=168475 RepID=UPI002545B6AE|nr:uncharacterized protein N7495_004728 [Penicillium taxi]KAJ5899984.1 hypothetical protein N7495_004728 [Penicillium taxi]
MTSAFNFEVNSGIQIADNHGTITAEFYPSKRPKTSHHDVMPVSRYDQYTIAWICALYIEMAAAQAMLDNFHEALPTHREDRNTYVLGDINKHNVVIACLPVEQHGPSNAAIVMTNMKRAFPAIRVCLMVGIAGGVPNKADLRLGDIVVGTRVMQYDLGQVLGDRLLQQTAIPRIPHQLLGTVVSTIRSKHEISPSRVKSILEQKLRGNPEYSRPDSPDRLFYAIYDHESSSDSCDGCDHSKLVPRSRRISDEVMIHYGVIASGNQAIRDGTTRDIIARQLDVICFETESAALMDILPCLPIRGIYNYLDAHKSDEWQRYATATAAAYARELLEELPYFEDLAQQSTAQGVPFRICFSSRHYPYIIIQQGIRLTIEGQLGHTEDLATYVTSRLIIKEPTLIEELQPQLLSKAAGVFMWIILVVDILNKEYRQGGIALRMRLAEIPSDLSELFKDILRRDNENMEALQLCILWILYLKIPLRPHEFYHALWSGFSLKGLVDSQIPDIAILETGARANIVIRYVISSLKGLAETTKSDQSTIQFIHEFVRDFLIKDKGLYELWPELEFDCGSLGHEKLKECCNLYINHTLICASVDRLPSESTSNNQKKTLTKYPFLEYASQNILYHANAAAIIVLQDTFLSYFPVSRWISTSNIFEKFKNRKYTSSASLFYILADKGHPALIRAKLKVDPQIHVFGERYNYPIFAGLASGNKDAVAALLNSPSRIYNGVDITEGLNHRKDLKEYKNRTPLSWAAQDGRAEIVELLLQERTICNELDRGGGTPLSRASLNGHETVARILIDKGADVNTSDNNGWTPLQSASSKGHETLARLLIDKGADINTSDNNGWTPLYWALSNGHETLARLLIDKGADVNASNSSGWTPLHMASWNGHEAVARILIERGSNVHNSNKSGRTLLDLALLNGYEAVASLLIDKGADYVNASDNVQRTLL